MVAPIKTLHFIVYQHHKAKNFYKEMLKMEKERKIVVAVDESEESMHALSWSLSHLIAPNASTPSTLVLLYVQPPLSVYSSYDAAAGNMFSGDGVVALKKYGSELVNRVMQRAEAVYREFEQNQLQVEKVVRSGDAKDVICSTVEKLRADTLVMGSHGYGFFKRALLGSVSDHCAKHAKCPVVIVKA